MESGQALFEASQWLLALQLFWWPFVRIMAALSVAPLFGQRSLPVRARLLLALLLTVALLPTLPAAPQIEVLSPAGALATVEQILFGILLGLMLQLSFAVFTVTGEVVSTQMGMGMARYNDPVNGVSSTSIVYQVFFVLLMLVFVALDGHLLVVSVLHKSFTLWPVGAGLHYFGFQAFVHAMAWVFAAALLIALPATFCLFLTQFCFGLLNRISPAMNLFSLGFPIAILVGLLCINLLVPYLPENYLKLSRQLLDNLAVLLPGGLDG